MRFSGAAEEIGRELRDFVPALMEAWAVPGVSVALIEDGRIGWLGCWGHTNRETLQPVHEGTAFEAAALSKPLFALATLRFQEFGRLALDEPLGTYLDSPYVEGDPRAAAITLKHALSHATGFPNWRSVSRPLRTYFAPGTRFGYSGEGYVYAQKALERVAGSDLESIMRQAVFDPLRMLCSSYVWPIPGEHRVALGHDAQGHPIPKRPWPVPNAAGSLHTTAEDYARFMVEVVNAARGDGSLLAGDTAREMLTSQIPVNDSDSRDEDWPRVDARNVEGLSWGPGWGLEDSQDGRNFWQWGDHTNYRSFAVGCADHGCGLVALTNSGTGWNVFRPLLEAAGAGHHPSLDWLERVHWRREH